MHVILMTGKCRVTVVANVHVLMIISRRNKPATREN